MGKLLHINMDSCYIVRRIFNVHGQEMFSLRKLKRNDIVYVTCGETWQNPTVLKSDAQRRQILTKLVADVKKIHEYCILRDPGDVVVSMESGIVEGSRLIVAHRVDEKKMNDQRDCKKDNKESEAEKPSHGQENAGDKTFHEKSHEFSEEWLAARKYPWQQEIVASSFESEKGDQSEKKLPRTPRSGSRSPRASLKSPRALQRFQFRDGFISPESDPSLAFGVPGLDLETFAGMSEVCLCKKDIDDLSQRWDIRDDGTIRPLCDSSSGLTVCLPAISNAEERSPKSYCVLLQKLKSYVVGSANQKWHFDSKTHLIKAFYSTVADKEVTAANHASVCTHAVRGPERLNQDGYIVEMKGCVSSNPVVVCRSCATVMRGGRYPLTHAPINWSFICAMGDPKKNGLKRQGSFKCLNGKVDLSTYEAERTFNHWASQLQRLRQETSVRSIHREMNSVEYTQAWKLLIRRNGDGYRSKPEMIVGSSVTGVLDQCSQKLSLSSAARRLYTEDGTHILHMDQLKQWLERVGRKSKTLPHSQHHQQESASVSDAPRTNVDLDKAEKQNDGYNSNEGTPDHSTAEYGTQDLTRKPKKKTQQPSISQAVTDQFISESPQMTAVEIWVSCGENFINPIVADKMNQESIIGHMERNALNLEMDTQLHVIRQIHGRRRGHMNPAELIPTKDINKPVVVKGGWRETTKEEVDRTEVYNQIKDIQKPKRPRSAARLQGNLYKQPQMKRITVRASDDSTMSVYAWGSSMDSLLDDAATKLDIRRIDRAFYTKEGKKIRLFEDINRNAELFVKPRRPGSTIRMKTSWARTRKQFGPEATQIVVTGPKSGKKITYVPPTNQLVPFRLSASSSSTSGSDDE